MGCTCLQIDLYAQVGIAYSGNKIQGMTLARNARDISVGMGCAASPQKTNIGLRLTNSYTLILTLLSERDRGVAERNGKILCPRAKTELGADGGYMRDNGR